MSSEAPRTPYYKIPTEGVFLWVGHLGRGERAQRGGVAPLVQVLALHPDAAVRLDALRALWSIVVDVQNQGAVRDAGGVSVFVSVLVVGLPAEREATAGLLTTLAANPGTVPLLHARSRTTKGSVHVGLPVPHYALLLLFGQRPGTLTRHIAGERWCDGSRQLRGDAVVWGN